MNQQDIENLARLSGATDEEGRKATNIFCFTKDELHGFATSLINESIAYVKQKSRDSDVPKNIKNFYQAYCMLLIWNPDLMNCLPLADRRKYQRLNYRARGIVYHDRELNQ